MNEQEILNKIEALSNTTYANADGSYYGGYGWDDDGGRGVFVQLLSKDGLVITNYFLIIGENCEIEDFYWIHADWHQKDKEEKLENIPKSVIDTALEIAKLAYF